MDIEIPNEIMIGGVTYQVEFVDDIQGLAAQILFHEGKIQISDTLSNSVAFVSFMHELVHGVFQQQAIFMNDRVYMDETLVETSAQTLTQIFIQILEYNMNKEEDINTLIIGEDIDEM